MVKLWEMGVRGNKWRVVKMYDITQSAVYWRGKNPNRL